MNHKLETMQELLEVMERLLGPGGCPWDREQTHQTLTRYLIEESYEVIEAIQEENIDKLQEELGDVLLQVVFHAALAEKAGTFDFSDVAHTIAHKMISRHPHVFADMDLKTSDDVMAHWEGFKKAEGKKHLLDGIPAMLPALMRAEKLQEKAARVGFDWPVIDGVLDKVREEIDELAEATGDEVEEELGDLLFALVNLARFKAVDPEKALQAANDKFYRRFRYIEDKINDTGRQLEQSSLQEMDRYWDEAKSKGF